MGKQFRWDEGDGNNTRLVVLSRKDLKVLVDQMVPNFSSYHYANAFEVGVLSKHTHTHAHAKYKATMTTVCYLFFLLLLTLKTVQNEDSTVLSILVDHLNGPRQDLENQFYDMYNANFDYNQTNDLYRHDIDLKGVGEDDDGSFPTNAPVTREPVMNFSKSEFQGCPCNAYKWW